MGGEAQMTSLTNPLYRYKVSNHACKGVSQKCAFNILNGPEARPEGDTPSTAPSCCSRMPINIFSKKFWLTTRSPQTMPLAYQKAHHDIDNTQPTSMEQHYLHTINNLSHTDSPSMCPQLHPPLWTSLGGFCQAIGGGESKVKQQLSEGHAHLIKGQPHQLESTKTVLLMNAHTAGE